MLLYFNILTIRCHQKQDETMSWHIAVSDTKVFAFLGVYYRQVYSPNRQRGRNQKNYAVIECLKEKSH